MIRIWVPSMIGATARGWGKEVVPGEKRSMEPRTPLLVSLLEAQTLAVRVSGKVLMPTDSGQRATLEWMPGQPQHIGNGFGWGGSLCVLLAWSFKPCSRVQSPPLTMVLSSPDCELSASHKSLQRYTPCLKVWAQQAAPTSPQTAPSASGWLRFRSRAKATLGKKVSSCSSHQLLLRVHVVALLGKSI